MKAAAIFLALACMAGPAKAEWTFLTNTSDGHGRAYVDYSTIKIDGSKRSVWELWDYDDPQTTSGSVSGTYYSMTWLEQIDCAESKRRGLQVGYYSDHMQGGNYLGEKILTDPEMAIAPNTIAVTLQSNICSR